jgi:hypothetical protein
MPATMGRRELIAALGAAAVTWPVMAPAQQPMPVIGVVRMAKRWFAFRFRGSGVANRTQQSAALPIYAVLCLPRSGLQDAVD